jgi:hypothetical protein
MRWIERLRTAEKTSHTLGNEVPKVPKAPSGTFGTAYSQVSEVFHATCSECGRPIGADEPETWWGVNRVHGHCGEEAWRRSVGALVRDGSDVGVA